MNIERYKRTCGHCSNVGYFEEICEGSFVLKNQIEHIEDMGEIEWTLSHCSKVLRCPNCGGSTLLSGSMHSEMDDFPDYNQEYPADHSVDSGIPEAIAKEIEILRKLRLLDPKSHLVTCRRILERTCKDLGAKKKKLYEMVEELETSGKVVGPIKSLADALRIMGNLGAHDTDTKIIETDLIRIERALFIILDYLYIAPTLSEEIKNKAKS